MNKIDLAFSEAKGPLLSIYFTAGYPKIDSLKMILPALEQAGVDLVEIGMPFSDPLADGPVIQKSSQKAIENGMNLNLMFEQLRELKLNIPLILMGYLNPVWQYGIEKFLKSCQDCGVSGTILPDLPLEEYNKFSEEFKKNNVHNILLVTPQSSDERLRRIAGLSKGFIYAVSSASTTGTKGFSESNPEFFERIKALAPSVPIMIGFGIKSREDFKRAGQLSDGAIIGTEFIRMLEKFESASEILMTADIKDFVARIRS